MNKLLTILFEFSGAVVFWAEIISTLLGLAVAVYTSWKVSRLIIGEGQTNRLLQS